MEANQIAQRFKSLQFPEDISSCFFSENFKILYFFEIEMEHHEHNFDSGLNINPSCSNETWQRRQFILWKRGVTLYLGIIDNYGTMFGKLMLIEMLFHLWCGHQINIEREKIIHCKTGGLLIKITNKSKATTHPEKLDGTAWEPLDRIPAWEWVGEPGLVPA